MKSSTKKSYEKIKKLTEKNPGIEDHDIFYSYTKTTDYNVGWICPKCGSVYGPNTQECYKCNKSNITNNSTETLNKTIQ